MKENSYAIKSNVLEFHFKDDVMGKAGVDVRHYLELSVQRPNDNSLTERAIIVHLQGSSEDYKLEFNIVARVIFDFGEEAISADDKTFLNQYGQSACTELHKKINAVLSVMDAEWTLPPIPFPAQADQ